MLSRSGLGAHSVASGESQGEADQPPPLDGAGQLLKEHPDRTGCMATVPSSWHRGVDREGGEGAESLAYEQPANTCWFPS